MESAQTTAVFVLLGRHGADRADQGGAVGEDGDHVGATADLLVRPLLRVVGPNLPSDLAWEGGERLQVVLCGVQVAGGLGNLASWASRTCRIWAWTASVSGCSKISRWPFVCAGTVPMPE